MSGKQEKHLSTLRALQTIYYAFGEPLLTNEQHGKIWKALEDGLLLEGTEGIYFANVLDARARGAIQVTHIKGNVAKCTLEQLLYMIDSLVAKQKEKK